MDIFSISGFIICLFLLDFLKIWLELTRTSGDDMKN